MNSKAIDIILVGIAIIGVGVTTPAFINVRTQKKILQDYFDRRDEEDNEDLCEEE